MDLIEILIGVVVIIVGLIIGALAFNNLFPMEDRDEESDDSKPFL